MSACVLPQSKTTLFKNRTQSVTCKKYIASAIIKQGKNVDPTNQINNDLECVFCHSVKVSVFVMVKFTDQV